MTVRLSPAQYERLQKIADQEYRTVAAHLRSLILADFAARNGDDDFDAALGEGRR